MVCCSELTHNEFIGQMKIKLNKIPDRACYEKLYIAHDLFVFLLKNIAVGSYELKKVSDPRKVEEFLRMVLTKINEFESGISSYPHPYEHESEFLLDLKDLRRVVISLLL